MTEKLYYKDAYIKDFTATVTECTEERGAYLIALDRTAFFPNEAGQSADGGTLSGVRVLDAFERGGIIYHKTEAPLGVGTAVKGEIDFPERFRKMQSHTAEHLLSGIIHTRHGFDNVGFHLGEDMVTFDASGKLEREDIAEIERLANLAIYENRRVSAYFPTASELENMEYRSKLELRQDVRIVSIDGYDDCACCAPHVGTLGEIGIIKILSFEMHRGGTRIYMLAGSDAYSDTVKKYEALRKISGMLSAPPEKTPEALSVFLAELENERYKNRALEERYVGLITATVPEEGNAVLYHPELSPEGLRALADSVATRISGIAVALGGEENNYKYVIASRGADLGKAAKEINSALEGRGGGRGEMIQGSFYTSLDRIKKYFK
ncbi:MAG: alanyl-tRNA editing protein [Clostridia bacterium]|nr:alanyl-tRNA editing protein [Clostridia bacterium]